MRYYVARGPIKYTICTWKLSLYEVNARMYAKVIRFYSDGTITKDIVKCINPYFIKRHCKEISQEEYEQTLGL